MSDFVGFKSPKRTATAAASAATLTAYAPSPHHRHQQQEQDDHTVIQMPMLAAESAAELPRGSGIGHGVDVSPAMFDDSATPTPILRDESGSLAIGATAKVSAARKAASFHHQGHSIGGSLGPTHASLAAPLLGREPPVPRVFLSYAFAHNSFFARRLLRVSLAVATVMAAGLTVYYAYRPKSIVLNANFSQNYGFYLHDPGAVYTLRATSCENMVGFSALVFHALPAVILLAMPGTGLRTFEPFKRQPQRDEYGNLNKIKRMFVFQACELLAVATLAFASLVFVFFWYMFFNGAAFACDTLRVHAFALFALFCYFGIFVQLVYFARYREHIKMQLGAFTEGDQTGNVRKHLVDPVAAELMTKDDQIIALIQKRLYKATSLGDLREMRTVLELARNKKLDEKGFPMKYYGNAKIYFKCFGHSKKNPMHVAAFNGNIEALELLRSYGFESTTLDKFHRVRFSTGDLFWYFAHFLVSKPVQSGEDDAVSIFKTTLVTPLHCAVLTGQLDTVRWLIAHGAEVGTAAQSSYRSERIPPIFLAETPAVVRELLENGANHLAIPDPGYMNTLTALQLAYLRGNYSVAQELEEWGCDIALTPFHSAAAMNDTAAVRSFIRRGTNINCLGEHGYVGMNRRTPLHWAAVSGSMETVELLLEAGAEPNFQDARGRTPLHWAARLNKLAIVKSLLAKGALPNVTDVDQMTALMCAANARGATRELFSVLVEAGADINYQMPTTGDTALHMAVRGDNEESALALLACGGNIMKVNTDGLRPLDCSTDTKLLFAIKRAAGHRDVMISYTHTHAEFAKKLRKSLEDANVTTWLDLMDPSGIGGGAVWREEIARGITNAVLVVCILTEDYAQSEWCLKELALAKQVGTPILAVSTESVRIGEELQVYLYTRQIIPFEPAITETKRNAENARQIEYEYVESKYKTQFNLLLDGVRDEIEKRRNDTLTKTRGKANTSALNTSIISTGFSKMFQPWDAPGAQYVFVSHGDRHAQFVHRMCQELKTREITFYGDRNVDGQTFDERIHLAKEAILKCTCFIVILSKETMASEIVRDQLAFAEDKGRPIFPVVLNEVAIGFDKRYSLARTEFYHFLADGFSFNSSFNSLFSGLQRHYMQEKKQIANASSGPPSAGLNNTSFANASFISDGPFSSFLHAGEPPATTGTMLTTGSSMHSSFVSDDSDGDPVMGKRTPYVPEQQLPPPRDRPTSVIQEGEEPNRDSRDSRDSTGTSGSSIGRLDSIRNLDSLSSLGAEDREHIDLVRM